MTMNNMVKEFEDKGFETRKEYISAEHQYKFRIQKCGIAAIGYFDFAPDDSNVSRDRRQREFIESLCNAWDQKRVAVENGNLRPTGSVRSTSDERANPDKPLKIKVVHFSNGVTTVIWEDGTKSQVRCQLGDRFDPEKGLVLAIAKRALGNKGSWYDEIKKWVDPYYRQISEQSYDNILNMFGINLKQPKLYIGGLEFTTREDGGANVKYVGPQDADEAKTAETSKSITSENHTDIRCSTCRFVKTPVTQIPCCGCDMGYSCWEPNEAVDQDIDEETHYNPIEEAYNLAIKARDGKDVNIEDVIGFLGEALDE